MSGVSIRCFGRSEAAAEFWVVRAAGDEPRKTGQRLQFGEEAAHVSHYSSEGKALNACFSSMGVGG
jgi:hypothetical protein